MADIRINSLPTTASASSSDDFLALDGATNGTRKLNAYSPTFGGNLTVSGSATIGAGLTSNGDPGLQVNATSSIGRVVFSRTAGTLQSWQVGTTGNDATAIAFNIDDNTVGATRFKIAATTGLVTIGQNLTVNGTGTSTFAGNLTASGTIRFDGQLLCGNAGGIQIRSAAGDANLVDVSGGRNLTMSGAATFGGNLTVSGTGTSSVAGKFGVGSTSPNFTGYGIDTAVQTIGGSGSLINGVLELYGTRTTDAQLGHVTFGNSGTRVVDIVAFRSGANDSARLDFWTASAGSLGLRASIAANGNFLLGTTTDSANGRVQLATHTTSAGGIGFGTDTSLYRTAAGDVSLDGPGGSDAILRFKKGGVEALRVESNVGSGYITASGTLYVRSGGSTALTLDSSQNAIFAGSTGVQLKNDSFLYFGSTVRTAVKGNSTGSLELYSNNNLSLTLDSSANATFAGSAQSNANGSQFISYNSNGSADQKYWSFQAGAAVGDGVLRLRALNDAGTNGKNAIVVKRTGISSVIVNLPSLPTSSAGLAAGDLWNDSGTVKVV